MKAIFTFIFLNFFVVITSFAQDYKNLGDNAMNSGNYDQAIEYYQKDYDQNPSDDLTKLINISQKLKKEFSEVDGAISSRNYASAEQHLNNILMIDPNNKFVEQKRQQIKQNQANAKQWKREGRREKFWSGFKGDDDVHEMFGGFHFRLGYSNINTQTFEMIKNDIKDGTYFDLYYNNSKVFPLTFDLGVQSNENYSAFNFGTYFIYKLSDHFTFDFGGGYQQGSISAIDPNLNYYFSNPYYKVGCTLMFENKYWGGLNYSYLQGIGSKYTVPTHNITYIFGRKPTKWISTAALVIGLLALASAS